MYTVRVVITVAHVGIGLDMAHGGDGKQRKAIDALNKVYFGGAEVTIEDDEMKVAFEILFAMVEKMDVEHEGALDRRDVQSVTVSFGSTMRNANMAQGVATLRSRRENTVNCVWWRLAIGSAACEKIGELAETAALLVEFNATVQNTVFWWWPDEGM